MAEDSKSEDRRELVRRALRTIDELQGRLEVAESALRSPIAIVGIGCRYPGGISNPESFWRLLYSETDAVTEVPAERWDIAAWYDADRGRAGKMSTRWGGFLDGIDQFDAQFFGISPREAALLDPQHRILLEVAWEALEHAGQPMTRLAGSATGIFVGLTNNEYYQHLLRTIEPALLSPYMATGNVPNAAPGRLAYFLGTQGPSLAVDTACSSSLTAVHLACQALRVGDCQMALAGGVNVIVVPETAVMFSKWGMMAADGRCKAFDAAADGFVRSEGCGIIVLKRLGDALAAGDRVLAVIEGSAVNQDGRSSGLTVPNGLAQQALIRQALENARVEPGQIDYIEAHGTGTALGDPIEVEAIMAVFGADRSPQRRLRIGSVKTNLGHTESASGIAGLIKCVLALEHELLPSQLHLREPSPAIAWNTMPIEVVAAPLPWPRGAQPRRAGVSSFGFSGANAHMIIAEAPAAPSTTECWRRPQHVLAFSARDGNALMELGRRYAVALRAPGPVTLSDFCFTANTGRAQHRQRAAVCAQSSAELASALERLTAGIEGTCLRGHAGSDAPKVAFLFSGQGSQYVGMGRALYETQPVFRSELERCAALLAPQLDHPLLELLFAPADRAARLDQTIYTQPALFALEWSLAQMWRAWGVQPTALLGHSVGEYVAACQGGIMSLEDGLCLIAERARLMQSLPTNGAMAVVAADENAVRALLAPHGDSAVIAAVNGPLNCVISGRTETIAAILEQLHARQVSAVPLSVSHAFHSPLVDPILDRLEHSAQRPAYARAVVPIVANLSGEFALGEELASASYWRRHARYPVRFAQGMQTLHRKGCSVYLEIGPAPVLINMGRQCLAEGPEVWLPSLVRGHDEWASVLRSLSQMYVQGINVDWAGFDRGYARRRVALPTYPFQRKRHWIDSRTAPEGAAVSVPDQGRRALLRRLPGSPLVPEIVFAGEFGLALQPWLGDHVVGGQVIVPLTAYVEMALCAGAELLHSRLLRIEDLVVRERLLVSTDGNRNVQMILSPHSGTGGWEFRIISFAERSSEQWLLHANGRLCPLSQGATHPETERNEGNLDQRGRTPIEREEHYRRFRAQGIEFGSAFRGVMSVQQGDARAIGAIVDPDEDALSDTHSVFHPALLDACLQPLIHAWPAPAAGETLLPFALDRLDLWGTPTARMTSYCHARTEGLASTGERAGLLVGDATVVDTQGRVIAELHGLTALRSGTDAATDTLNDWLYEVAWRASSASSNGIDNLMPTAAEASERAGLNRLGYLRQSADAGYTAGMRRLEARSLTLVRAALQSLGWNSHLNETIHRTSIAQQLGVPARHAPLLRRLFDRMSAAGHSETVPGGWLLRQPLDEPDPELDWSVSQLPDSMQAEGTLLETCGTRLRSVLRGECDPLELLFGADSGATLEQIYRDSITTTATNRLAADVIAGVIERMPPLRPVRVLEIGAGTGGTSAHVLPRLPPARTEYCFSELSPSLLARARSRFKAFPFVRYELLDIERALAPQGFGGRQFDVILAANVLHATTDLRTALVHLRELLRPDGLLVLVEGTRAQTWIDLTFGLTEGWWKFTDFSLRPDYPLLPIDAWLRLLAEQGFAAPLHLDGPAVEGEASDYTVLVAGGREAQPVSAAPRERWLLFSDDRGTGRDLMAELERMGRDCVSVRAGASFAAAGPNTFIIDPTQRDHYDRLLETIEGSDRRCAGVVHLWSLNATLSESTTSQQLLCAQDYSCRSLLYLAQALARSGRSLSSGLWALTRGSQAAAHDLERLAVAQSAIWGLAKVLALEHPELRPRRLDLDPSTLELDAEQRLRETRSITALLSDPLGEAQWALRHGLLYRPRLVRAQRLERAPEHLIAADAGRLDSLQWQPMTRRTPGPDEIEIRVHAVGLNFRDVLGALGVYAGESSPLGGEVAGQVVAVGSGVRDLLVGDRVAALAIGGFSDYVITTADLALRQPRDWSVAEIVTVPAAYATAYHALIELAQVRRGQRVLIHTATGGVGLAAVQLAQQAGCEIIATAGSPSKRDYLRALGVAHVFDSRSPRFADDICRLLGHDGAVDVVLNTLSGECIEAGLSVLATEGTFVELGKRDVWEAARVADLRPRAAYHIVDLAALCARAPAAFRPIWAAATAAIVAGTLRPLPRQIFAREQVQSAFRYMAQARHIGKIVIVCAPHGSHATWQPPAAVPFAASAAASYLITGGLQGLGLRSAAWLVSNGARHLALMARSEPVAAVLEVLSTWRAAGVQVLVWRGDVARPPDVEALLGAMRQAMPPLRGVIHAAGMLDDGALLAQEWSRFERVLAPKVAGAWNLHQATSAMPLDFFVCYSSASALLGSAGQGNHSAANALLDALAHHRRALGRPALSINWGAWSQIGAAAQREVFDRVAEYGVAPITPEQGIAALAKLITNDSVHTAVIPMDWSRFGATQRSAPELRFFAELLHDVARPYLATNSIVPIKGGPSLEIQLQVAQPGERRRFMQSSIRAAVVGVLGLDPDTPLDPQQSFRDLGFDSLLSIELRNRLQAATGRPLPATLAFDFPSVSAMLEHLCALDAPEIELRPESEPGGLALESDIAALRNLSDLDAERELAAELARARDILS